MSQAPERIHGWLDSQLSLARFSGGITFNGTRYLVAYDEEGQPLVRDDVLKRERQERQAAARQAKADAADKQEPLL